MQMYERELSIYC